MINKKICDNISDDDINNGELDLSKKSKILSNLSSNYLSEVIGQEGAKDILENILEKLISGININNDGYKNKPIASLIFAGPSGVGKTLLAKKAQLILNKHFKNELEIIKINCADFSGEQNIGITRLIGSSAGYIGSDKKPQFHPDNIEGKGRVILLDEIEKAGTTFWNIFLSILDDGELDINYTKPEKKSISYNINLESNNSDSENSSLKTFFKDTIIIMTSNIGNDRINKEVSGSSIGFNNSNINIKDLDIERIILEEFGKQFKIEMQGRFNHVVPFNHFTKEDAKLILDQILNKLITKTLSKSSGFIIEFSDKVKNFMLDNIFNSKDLRKYGGRFIEGYVDKNITLYISRAKNSGEFSGEKNSYLFITEKKGKIFFSKIPIIDTSNTKNNVNKIINL